MSSQPIPLRRKLPITYSKKGRRAAPTPPASQPTQSSSQSLVVAPRIPFNHPSIQQIAADKAGLSLSDWLLAQKSLDGDVEPLLDSEDEREFGEIFYVAQDDLDLGVSDDDRVINPTQLPTLSREDLVKVKDQWAQYYGEGIRALAEAVMKEEIEARLKDKKALQDSDLAWTAAVMTDILLSTDRILLESVMLGNLALDKRNNPKLKGILARLQQQAENQPSIYHQLLVDKNGESPTPNDLLKAANYMMGYMKECDEEKTDEIQDNAISVDDAYTIDTFKGFRKTALDKKATQSGFRKYMYTKSRVSTKGKGKGKAAAPAKGKGKGKAKAAPPPSSSSNGSGSDSDDSSGPTKKTQKKATTGAQSKTTYENKYLAAHATQAIIFVEALRERIAQIDQNDLDKPLPFPLVEVGYSNRSINRLKAHKAHSSSNYIMNLMEAIFCEFPTEFSGDFAIEQSIIYFIWKVEQAEVSEIGWTKLAEGYIHNAGGFSHYPTGLSYESAQKIAHREWDAALQYLVERSVYPKNFKHQQEVAKNECEALERDAEQQLKAVVNEHNARVTKALNSVRDHIDKNKADSSGIHLEQKLASPHQMTDNLRKSTPAELDVLSEAVETVLKVNEELHPLRKASRLAQRIVQRLGEGQSDKDAEEATTSAANQAAAGTECDLDIDDEMTDVDVDVEAGVGNGSGDEAKGEAADEAEVIVAPRIAARELAMRMGFQL